MNQKTTKKVAFVSGSSRGIGRTIAQTLAASSFFTFVNYAHSRDSAEALVKEIKSAGGEAIAVEGDISKSSEIDKILSFVQEMTGHIDVLVNNAGSVLYRPLKETSEEDFEKIFATNTKGTFLMMKKSLPLMRRGGRIINLSSSVTQLSIPTYGTYSASKAAVEQLSRTFAREIGAETEITVNCVAPGPTDTDLFRIGKTDKQISKLVGQTPLSRLGTPQDIADVVQFLASDAARWITGQTIRVNGGFV